MSDAADGTRRCLRGVRVAAGAAVLLVGLAGIICGPQRKLSPDAKTGGAMAVVGHGEEIEAGRQQRTSAEQAKLYVQLGHSIAVSSVAFSPDGRFVLTGGADKTARLWDAATGRELRKYEGHSEAVSSVAFSPDGLYVLTGSSDHTVRLWDISTTGQEIWRLEGRMESVHSVAFSPDGRYVLAASAEDTARLWDTATGQEVQQYRGHSDRITSAVLSRDGRFVLTGSLDRTARLWNTATGKELRQFRGLEWVFCVAFSPDGRYVLTDDLEEIPNDFTRSGIVHTARLWDVTTGQQIRKFQGHAEALTSLAFSPDGRFVLTGSSDKTARLWGTATGREVRRFEGHSEAVTSVAFSPDGRFVLTGSSDRTARLWDAATGREVRRFESHADGVTSAVFSADGRYLLTGGWDHTAHLWDLTTGQQIRQFRGHSDVVTSVTFSQDGRYVLTGSEDQTARLWNSVTGEQVQQFQAQRDTVLWNGVLSVAVSPNGLLALTGSSDHTASLWDVASGQQIRRFFHSLAVTSVAFSPDGRTALSGTMRGTFKLCDVATGQQIHSFMAHAEEVTSAALSSDTRYVLTGSFFNTAQLWDVATGQQIRQFRGSPYQGHSSEITSVAFSQDGRFVFTGNWDRTAHLWDVATGRELRQLGGHSGDINSAVFSPDARFLLTAGDDAARLWDVAGGLPLAALVSDREGGWIVVDPDGRFDTNDLETIRGLHWIMREEPLRGLPVEIFMRDYYEPKLVPRLLNCEATTASHPDACEKEFKKVRPLAELDRTQPFVDEPEVTQEDGHADWMTVRVRVKSVTSEVQKDAEGRYRQSGVYDVRLFRDGQLVRWAPRDSTKWQEASNDRGDQPDGVNLESWKNAHEITAKRPEVEGVEPDGTMVVRFEHVPLPHRSGQKEVEWSAYAFNDDRVKSETKRKTIPLPSGWESRKGTAYVITVGVNRTGSAPAWNLEYAARDAREMSRVVSEDLRGTVQRQGRNATLSKVVPVRLVSDEGGLQSGELPARQAYLKAVLQLLAGQEPDPKLKAEILKTARIEQAQPEDLVLLTVSSHGYTDHRGTFHFVLGDVTVAQTVTPTLDQQTLSSDQLSAWLREVDAGELVLVVDACQSETTIQTEGFKPGPMGSRGLGQLAYDKGMRVLAASKAKESAFELGTDAQGHKIDQGLLSYALVQEGLVEKQADTNHDGQITMGEWLRYAEQEVPRLFQQGASKGVVERKGAPGHTLDRYLGKRQGDVGGDIGGTPARYQQPTLFDFNKAIRETVLIGES